MPGSSVSLLCSSACSSLSHSVAPVQYTVIDQTVDFAELLNDPEMTFFKEDMGLR